VLWSNPGETVLTPFMGVGSEVYGAVRNGRKAIGAELKSSYFRQAVLNVAEAKSLRAAEDVPLPLAALFEEEVTP
jgi:DNA modification methylase